MVLYCPKEKRKEEVICEVKEFIAKNPLPESYNYKKCQGARGCRLPFQTKGC